MSNPAQSSYTPCGVEAQRTATVAVPVVVEVGVEGVPAL